MAEGPKDLSVKIEGVFAGLGLGAFISDAKINDAMINVDRFSGRVDTFKARNLRLDRDPISLRQLVPRGTGREGMEHGIKQVTAAASDELARRPDCMHCVHQKTVTSRDDQVNMDAQLLTLKIKCERSVCARDSITYGDLKAMEEEIWGTVAKTKSTAPAETSRDQPSTNRDDAW
jgi:hypothetical protein